jgi:hypothetical protein
MPDKQFSFWFEDTVDFREKALDILNMFKGEKADSNIETFIFNGKLFFEVGNEVFWSSGMVEEHFL